MPFPADRLLRRVEGREFLLDAGYAAPFLQPLPRDLPVDVLGAIGSLSDAWG